MIRVAHYLNQFFGGLGGEAAADLACQVREEAIGPGRAIARALGETGAVVSTMICGDNFFNERAEESEATVRGWLKQVSPDLIVAGPAFMAGRYGVACARVCAIAGELGLPAVTGMHPENPGRIVNAAAYVVPTARTAAGMAPAVNAIVKLGVKLASGAPLGPAREEGYLPRGRRRPWMADTPGAERAVRMLVAKLRGEPFESEIPIDSYDSVAPAPPIRLLGDALLALVTTGAIVPLGNPDRLKRCSETRWVTYPLDDRDRLDGTEFECVHGGFFNVPASQNPNLVLPLDAVRALQRESAFGELLPYYLTTTGNDMRLLDCRRNGDEMAATLKRDGVDGVLLVAT